MLIASKNVKASTVPELLSELRAAPGKYTYGGSVVVAALTSYGIRVWLVPDRPTASLRRTFAAFRRSIILLLADFSDALEMSSEPTVPFHVAVYGQFTVRHLMVSNVKGRFANSAFTMS